jgi:hypothetical protein
MATGNTDITDTSTSSVSGSTPKQTDRLVNTSATGPIQQPDKTGVTSVASAHNPDNAFASDRPSNSHSAFGPGANPSVSADLASGAQNTQKQQGADRPHEEPSGDETDAIRDTKQEAESAQNAGASSADPKPLTETRGGATCKAPGGDDGPQKESHGEGTGEKYVKSTGMKADGGDFDAANAGAGKEADRKNA